MEIRLFNGLFLLDHLGALMMGLVGFVSVVVGCFAARYLRGNTHYGRFFVLLLLLVSSTLLMGCADHLVVLFITWQLSNLLLVRLMIHKQVWKAARASGWLAYKNFALGFIFTGSAFALLYLSTGHTSIHQLIRTSSEAFLMVPALILLIMGAMTQSAIWPFHRWLTSSLNSPTPVSALMHAGLVNGGGFLLARFAPLFFAFPKLLTGLFVVGLITALIGTLWKLMQHSVKRVLACSTMGQMGFMIAQCGLGLFPAALAHLCWHGLFKAYLFLGSGTVAAAPERKKKESVSLFSFAFALLCGGVGAVGFAFASFKDLLAKDTNLVLIVVAFIAGSQFALSVLRHLSLKRIGLALFLTATLGSLYGWNVHLIEWLVAPLHISRPQPLTIFHYCGMILMTLGWLGTLFGRQLMGEGNRPKWMLRFYVKALNGSQPHPTTITSHRNQYEYI